jgi:hypothetical protein
MGDEREGHDAGLFRPRIDYGGDDERKPCCGWYGVHHAMNCPRNHEKAMVAGGRTAPKRLANVDNSRDRINRLRNRLHGATTPGQLRDVLHGILDLLGDQL